MRLGAVFPQGQFPTVDPDAVVRLVQRLEDAGYDHLLVYDHVLGADISNRPDWTGYYSSADPFLEPLVLFAYVARGVLARARDRRARGAATSDCIARQAGGDAPRCSRPAASASASASGGTTSSTRRSVWTSDAGRPGWRSRSHCCVSSGPSRAWTTPV